MLKPTVSPKLDTRRVSKKTGRYPIKICVTFRQFKAGKKSWLRKYYPTGCAATAAEYESIMGSPRGTELKKIKEQVGAARRKAEDIIDDHDVYDVTTFEVLFLSEGNTRQIQQMFTRKIAECKARQKISTAEKYQSALTVIHNYAGEGISYVEITPDWLHGFEEDYCKKYSLATFSIYIRCLRHIFTRAVSMRLIDPALYPFGKEKYRVRSYRRPMKRYLSPEEKDLFLEYKSHRSAINKYHDFWVFSYFANGMNCADIADLRRRNIRADHIRYDRRKTEDTDVNKVDIVIPMRKEILEIIARWGNKTLDPDAYVFPILSKGMSEERRFRRIRTFVQNFNDALNEIRKELGIEGKITTYTARHTFANQMRLAGASTEFIQDALGHADKRTTEIYMDGFSLEAKRKFSEKL